MLLPTEIQCLSNCKLCPRECGANRVLEKTGFCKTDALFRVSAVCAHKGEESVISGSKGICNVFFPHCNLQCVYCQNADISANNIDNLPEAQIFDKLITKICSVLDTTENIVGFVSPSHYVMQMKAIIRGILETGRKPVFVYNTNAYDKPDTLKMLEGIIDVYLPDFKYTNSSTASMYSQATDYPKAALAAIKEMYRQKGSTLIVDDKGIVQSGIILRHLVLPGMVNQSIEALKCIAEEISPKIHLSLMSQYYPAHFAKNYPEINRSLFEEEYKDVLEACYSLGFYRGWMQDLESTKIFRPDFSAESPFNE